MKKLLCMLFVAMPTMLLAKAPFDGTWVAKLDSAHFPSKPDVYLLNKGM
jgi:hypothetical protein